MVLNRKIALMAVSVVVTAVVVSALTTALMFRVATNSMPGRMTAYNSRPPGNSWPMFNQPRGGMAVPMHRGFAGPTNQMQRGKAPTTLTVTSEQAKTTASNAVNALKVGEAKDTGNAWIVSVKYNDKVVMNVLVGKINAATSADAVKAVQDSMGRGWKVGDPKQLGSNYNVPIIDANGNAISNIRVDGRTGNITTKFAPMRR